MVTKVLLITKVAQHVGQLDPSCPLMHVESDGLQLFLLASLQNLSLFAELANATVSQAHKFVVWAAYCAFSQQI